MGESSIINGDRFVFPRHEIIIAILVKTEDEWLPYFTVNLSASGVLMAPDTSFNVGTELECMLSEHQLFPFTARVMRIVETRGVGMEFIEPTPEFSAAIGRIIASGQDL